MTDRPCCRDVAPLASAFIDGDLAPDAWARLRMHLDACPPCTEYVRQLTITVEAMRRLPGPCGERTRIELVQVFRTWAASRR